MSADLDYGHYYREWHDESDAHRDQMSTRLLEQLAPFLPSDVTRPALDIGCGMGFAMMALMRHGYQVVEGVDIDASQVEACLRRQLAVEKITDLKGHLDKYPGRFGLVVMLDVLEHIPVHSQLDVLRAIHGVLAPGGRLILQVPNASSILAFRWLYQDFTHVSSFTEHSISFALRNASFSRIDVPALENRLDRPSLRPWKFFAKGNRWYFQRWLVRWVWRKVLEAELPGQDIAKIPQTLNLLAIADKSA